MTPDKRKKIKALMESPASTENEKQICQKLLTYSPGQQKLKDEFERNQKQTKGREAYDRHTAQDARKRGAAQRQAAARHRAAQDPGPFAGKQYTPEEFERAQAMMDQRLKDMNEEISQRLADILNGK